MIFNFNLSGTVKKIILPPHFAHEEKTRIARFLNSISLTIMITTAPYAVVGLLQTPIQVYRFVLIVIMLSIALLTFILNRLEYVKQASIFISVATFLFTTGAVVITGGIGTPFTGVFFATPLIAGVVLGRMGGFVFGGLCLLSLLGIYMLDQGSYLPVPLLVETATTILVLKIAIFIVIAVILNFAVTNLSQAQEAIKKNLKRFEGLFEFAPDGIIIFNRRGKIELVNQEFENLFGYTKKEVIGSTVDMFIPSRFSHAGKVEKYMQEPTTRFMGSNLEIYAHRKDGSEFPVDISLGPWESDSGILVFAAIRDITEKKQFLANIQEKNAELKEALENLKASRTARERMESELKVANDIQMSMLPLKFPPFPQRQDFSIFAKIIPAREVGGDFYDFFFIDNDHFCFLIGDVSGKGVPAALFMAVTKTLIKSKTLTKSRITTENSPSSILTYLNDDLSTDNKTSMFVTVFLCIINLKTGILRYSNAGHNPPFVIKSNGKLIKMDKRHGPVIGALGGIKYEEDKISLSPNDKVFLYTDGVTEALDKNDSLFSEDRLEKFLVSKKFESVDEVTLVAIEEVKKFEGETDQADDITILSFEYLNNSNIDRNIWHFKIVNSLSEIEGLINSFNEFAEQNKISKQDMSQFDIALDDLTNNIISYGYKDNRKHEINFSGELSGNKLKITIIDNGKHFDPFQLEKPDITQSAEEREIGGLGIHLVKSIMDEVQYKRLKNSNKITIYKRVDYRDNDKNRRGKNEN